MKILVCIKQVPDTTDIRWTENNTIQRDGLESVINPYDLYALEEAIKIKRSRNDVTITALTMGPSQAEEILRKAIALGCDEGCLLCDKKFAGADTYATSRTISSAIRHHFNDFDLIICGQFAVDGDTAQTGPSIAAKLEIPQVTYVKEVIDSNEFYLTARRELEDGIETVQVKLPALICVLMGNYETSRPTINGIKRAQSAKIKVLTLEDILLQPEEAGLKGSPTYVSKAFRMIKKHHCMFIETNRLIQKLTEAKADE